jgi:hypothetical protein
VPPKPCFACRLGKPHREDFAIPHRHVAMVRRRTFPQDGHFINKQKGWPDRLGSLEPRSSSNFNRAVWPTSNSETVQVAVTLDIQRQICLIVQKLGVFGQLYILHRVGQASALISSLLYGSRQILQIGKR